MKIERVNSFLVISGVYAISYIAGLFTFFLIIGSGIILATLLADIAATVIVWLFGIIFKNSSLYDPYWSVTPIVIMVLWIFISTNELSGVHILMVVSILFWGIRLTKNWASGWKGLKHQDWRYTMLKEKSPKVWFFTNFLGINMMPTLLVYCALIPAYFIIDSQSKINFVSVLGFVICMASAFIQLISDRQMSIFRSNPDNRDKCINIGLWKFSRHPNYFGEIMFWWGLWIIQMGSIPKIWFTVFGPLFITLLFIFISIPMMERHIHEKRPCYAEYKNKVSMLIPLPINKSQEES